MEFRELSYLLAIDRCRNITKAAEELYISQSGLTKFLKRLEKSLGFELFRWTGNYMVPTPAGREYLDFARSVLAMKAELDQRIAALPQAGNALRVGVCLNSISSYQDAAAAFARLYPEVQLTFVEDFSKNILELLLEGELDLAFPAGMVQNPNLLVEHILSTEILLYLPASLMVPPRKTVPFSRYPWVDLEALREVPFITMRSSPQVRNGDQRLFQEYGFVPAVQTFVMSLQSKIQLAQTTPAACFLVIGPDGRSLANDFSDYDHLYSFGTHPFLGEVSAVYSKRLAQPFYAQEFIRLVKYAKEGNRSPGE